MEIKKIVRFHLTRAMAKILGVSSAYLSLLLNVKRPWRGDLKAGYEDPIDAAIN